MDISLPEDGYQGEYLIELAKKCIEDYGIGVLKENESFFEQYGKEHLLAAIKKTLAEYGIIFDVWFSEKTLHTDGSIERSLNILKEQAISMKMREHFGSARQSLAMTKIGSLKNRPVN